MSALDTANLAHKIAPALLREVFVDRGVAVNASIWPGIVSKAVGFDVSNMSPDEQIGLYFGHRLYVIASAAGRAFGRAEEEASREGWRSMGGSA